MLILANVSKAVVETIKEYLAFAGAMPVTEAMNILNISEGTPLSSALINRQASKISAKNKKALPASACILKKISSAEKVLLREIE
ncbi:uncharacterized protein NESG_00233 [Nematocida ausubeli]|uniref:Uncharacterized protein n=1 Tax=Nematocida ausubeli (strain ATCC PRA-371 / ERTm2) TaxID=1913371 RepID=A0A086J4T9_NEMA1|nr:uncharacterized protein NESG_00233 [Nematocida ausubeli]KAI5132886.1 hypothetical protein NEAUS07_0309 [Nematocida ausubeli]KAI5146672.1 hypothetical protein NEAUS05_0114 [Nematocida ausubeli]KFG27157.1 hypothetical protein NESG_00233 [Nematocida ausubeli]